MNNQKDMINIFIIINQLIHEKLDYKISIHDDEIDKEYRCVLGTYFLKRDVNSEGKYIGKKQQKLLFRTIDTYGYAAFKDVLNYKLTLSGYVLGTYVSEKEVFSILNNCIKTGIFVEDAKRLLELANKAKQNLESQQDVITKLKELNHFI